MAAPTFIAAAVSGEASGGGALTLTKPTGTTTGDIMMAVAHIQVSGGWTWSSGWNVLANEESPSASETTVSTSMAWKVDDGGAAGTATSAGTDWRAVVIATYRGVDATDPIGAEGTITKDTADPQSTSGITTTRDESVVVLLGASSINNLGATAPSGWNNRAVQDPGVIFDEEYPTADTATGSQAWDAGSFNPDQTVSALYEVCSQAAPGDEPTIVAGNVSGVFIGTTVAPVLPTHAANDILVVQGWKNDAGDLSVSGWTEIVADLSDTNLSSGWWWKRAASGAESNPTVTSSSSATSTAGLYGRCFVISGGPTSGDPFEDATVNGSPTSSTTPAGATITTTGADRLAVTFAAIDAAGAFASGLPPAAWTTVDNDAVAY